MGGGYPFRGLAACRLSGTQSLDGAVERFLHRQEVAFVCFSHPRISMSYSADITVRLKRREDHAYCRLLKRSPHLSPDRAHKPARQSLAILAYALRHGFAGVCRRPILDNLELDRLLMNRKV